MALSCYKRKQSVIRRGEEDVREGDFRTNIYGALSQPAGELEGAWPVPGDLQPTYGICAMITCWNSTPRKTGDAHSCWEKLPTEGRGFMHVSMCDSHEERGEPACHLQLHG